MRIFTAFFFALLIAGNVLANNEDVKAVPVPPAEPLITKEVIEEESVDTTYEKIKAFATSVQDRASAAKKAFVDKWNEMQESGDDSEAVQPAEE